MVDGKGWVSGGHGISGEARQGRQRHGGVPGKPGG